MTNAPNGTKLWILRLGATQGDLGWFLRGRNSSAVSHPAPEHERRRLEMFALLIDHPEIGLILYDCGAVPDPEVAWGPAFTDEFPWVEYTEANRLENAIALTGNDIRDVKAIVLSHLHLDHAGGLQHFVGTDVPVYVHETELRQAFYAVATKEDYGNYMPDYLSFDHNWQPLSGEKVSLFSGMTLYLAPGHANGLMALHLSLPQTGAILFTSDHCVFQESFNDLEPPGWGLRNQDAWYAAVRNLKRIAHQSNAKVFYGHDGVNLVNFATAPHFYE